MSELDIHIVRTAGAGRFGTCYVALEGERLVTLECADAAADPRAARDHWRAQMRARESIGHPALAQIHASIEFDGRPALVREHIGGVTLEAALERHAPFEAIAVAGVFEAICDALSAVHAAGFVCRNLAARDIGLVGSSSGAARTVRFLGLDFVPSQAYGARRTPSAAFPGVDIYLVGLLAWRALTGRALQVDPRAVLGVADAAIPELSQLLPEVPEAVSTLVGAMLHPMRDQRPAARDAAERWAAIDRAPATEPVALVDDLPTAFVGGRTGFLVDEPTPSVDSGALARALMARVPMPKARRESADLPLSAKISSRSRAPRRHDGRAPSSEDLARLEQLVGALGTTFHPTRRRDFARLVAELARRMGIEAAEAPARKLARLDRAPLETEDALIAQIASATRALQSARQA